MSLKSSFARSSGWMLLGTGADYFVQFLIFAVLARLLSVSDLGVVAFAVVLIDVGRIFVNGGLSESIVQRKEWHDRVASACFTAALVRSALFAIALAVVAGALMERYYSPGSGAPTAALSLIFIIEALRSIPAAKLRREFQYKKLAARMTVASVLSGAGAIGLALAGWGVWALVFQRLVSQVVLTVLTLLAAQWRPKFLRDAAILKEIAPYSTRVTMSRALEVLNNRMPDLLVGLLFGPVPVAIYRVGGRALEIILRIIIQPFQDASLSAFSRVGDAKAVGLALLRVTRAAALVTFPVFLGATAVAQELTELLFGPKYASSGSVMAVLAFGGIPATILYFTTSAYLAAGHPKALMRSNAGTAAANVVLISAIGSVLGALGAAIGTVGAQALMAPINLGLMRRYLGVTPISLLRALAAPFLASAAMAAMLWGVKLELLSGMANLPRLVALVALGGAIYPTILVIAGRPYLVELIADLAPLLPSAFQRWLESLSRTLSPRS